MRRSQAFLILCVFLSAVACDAPTKSASIGGRGSSNMDTGPTNFIPDAGRTGVIARDCVLDASCVDNNDCNTGTRCNTALSPPQCQQLYCGGEGTWCSEDGFCSEGNTCENSLCLACTDCGGECVRLENDPRHCGQCDRAIGEGMRCENGQPVCNELTETVCTEEAARCVDLKNNRDHCGACNHSCSSTALCGNGQCFSFTSWNIPTVNSIPLSCEAMCDNQANRSCVNTNFQNSFLLEELGCPGNSSLAGFITHYNRNPSDGGKCEIIPNCDSEIRSIFDLSSLSADDRVTCFCRVD